MTDVRKMGQGIRRRLGAPPNHLAMAKPDGPKQAVKQPEAPGSYQFNRSTHLKVQGGESGAMAEAGERSWAQDLAQGK